MRTFKIVEEQRYNKKILLLDKNEQTPWCKNPGNDVTIEVWMGCISVETDGATLVSLLGVGEEKKIHRKIPWWIFAKEKSVVLLTIR